MNYVEKILLLNLLKNGGEMETREILALGEETASCINRVNQILEKKSSDIPSRSANPLLGIKAPAGILKKQKNVGTDQISLSQECDKLRNDCSLLQQECDKLRNDCEKKDVFIEQLQKLAAENYASFGECNTNFAKNFDDLQRILMACQNDLLASQKGCFDRIKTSCSS